MGLNGVALDDKLLSVLQWLWATPPTVDSQIEARARELLLDTIGCAIAGAAEPEVAALFRHSAELDPGAIRFPGVPRSLTAAGFATAFAAASCWHEACEGLPAAHGRPGLHTIPAVLGPALLRGVRLGALLDAVVTGFEIGGRLGMVCRIRPGMHVDGTWGSFAAAAASCRLLGASPEAAMAALSHVACHMPFSLYWPISAGSTARNAYAGHGATHGAASAIASLSGLGGPPGSIAEMARLALGADPAALPAFPGAGIWLLPDGYLKPYPAVRHVHYGVAAAEAWYAAGVAQPDEITGITLRVYAEALTYCGNRAPATPIQAQFSLSYGVAHGLIHGRLGPDAHSTANMSDPLARRLEAMIAIHADPALTAAPRRGCVLEVQTGRGPWQRAVDEVPGDTSRPMTRAEISAKFRAYAAPVIGMTHAAKIEHRLLEGALDAPISLDA